MYTYCTALCTEVSVCAQYKRMYPYTRTHLYSIVALGFHAAQNSLRCKRGAGRLGARNHFCAETLHFVLALIADRHVSVDVEGKRRCFKF